MSKLRVLIVVTSHKELGNTGEKTGLWLEELAGPYYTFLDGGAAVTIASIQGGKPPIDPKSESSDWQTDMTERFKADQDAQQRLAKTVKVSEVDAGDYDTIFLSGGHGPMWDFADNEILANLIAAFDEEEKIVTAVCHGPAALLSATTAAGTPLVQGKQVTGFTNSEEEAVELAEVVPFLLEARLRALGADFASEQNFQPYVRKDGNLITGQNPASSAPAAKEVIRVLVAEAR